MTLYNFIQFNATDNPEIVFFRNIYLARHGEDISVPKFAYIAM